MKTIKFSQSWKNGLLGVQHLLGLFGATTLVPLITGMSIPVALFAAGAGTLLFHLVTKGKMPIFLGSSFAFIPGILAVAGREGLAHARGGIIVAGLLYLLFALLVYKVGVDRVYKIFPSYVTGTMIVIIGLSLIPTAVGMLEGFVVLGLITLAITAFMSFKGKGFFGQISILISITLGYLLAAGFGLVDFTAIALAPTVQIPGFELPMFSISAIMTITPFVLATFMEHIGDIATNQAVTGQDWFQDPGLHRTLVGDGVATALSGLIGGPANTTYSENTAILRLTGNYNPHIIRIAAVLSIIVSFSGKLNVLLQTIPAPVLGGVSLVLFFMIARTGFDIVHKQVKKIQKWQIGIIVTMLIVGLGNIALTPLFGIAIALPLAPGVALSEAGLAALVGIILNYIGRKMEERNV